MQPKADLAPRLGEWHGTDGHLPPDGENVLGYWYDWDAPWIRSVFIWEGQWCDAVNTDEAVDPPDAWASVIYPLEGE